MKLELELDDIKLIVALIKQADPTMFFSRDLRFRIIKQADDQVAVRHEVDNIHGISIVKKSEDNKDKIYRNDR